ncbi:MAG: hypothetical protein QGH51_04900 [Planctomycetota bacterium]|jgi:hypothetical protein|nr:hypothetical protein [Planctomycetota bacterium]
MKTLPAILLAGTLVAPLLAQEPSNQELSRRIDVLAEQIETIGLQETGGSVGSLHGMGPAASKVYSTESGISFGGYGEMLFTGKDSGNTWDFYRAITYIGYRFDENWVFNSEIEIEHVDEIALEFAYLDYEGENLGFRAGHLLAPMGWINELHEPTTFWSANRPDVERYLLPSTWHENGIGFYGEEGDFAWRAYAMTGFDAAGFDLSSSGLRGGRQKGSKATAEDLAFTGRLDWSGYPGLTAGVSLWSGDSGQGTGTDDFATTVWDAHFQYDRGPLRLRGLFTQAEVENANLLDTPSASDSLEGWYLEAGWDVFAERGDQTSLTPFVRVEQLDFLKDTAADTAEDRLTLGVAWQPMDRIIFKGDVVQSESIAGDEDIVEFSVGYIF